MTPGPLYLIRHAKAHNRHAWTEDDLLRPLTSEGERQAKALVSVFRGLALARLISSPHHRCMQTIAPLAEERGVKLETSEALAEGASVERALALAAGLDEGPTVLCSHGDVIEALVLHLAERATAIDGERAFEKASVWIIERSGDRFVRATYIPPPQI